MIEWYHDWHMIGHHCSWEWAYGAHIHHDVRIFPLSEFSHSVFNCSLISFLLVFLHCSLSVTLRPTMSFPLPINSFQPRSPALPRWLWPAVEEAFLACRAVSPVPSASRWAEPLCGRRRAAGAGPPSPAAAVPPVSASWARANQNPVSLLKTVRWRHANFSTSCIYTSAVVSLLDKEH